MTSKELLRRIDERDYLTEREHREFLKELENALDMLEAIKNKAQNNRFFRGCLLRMFVEIKRTPDGAFTKKEKIKDENYEKIMRWLDDRA